ncbi:MAG: sigma-70 family RNA polymerase sigma factor [Planctomycetota bacterium]
MADPPDLPRQRQPVETGATADLLRRVRDGDDPAVQTLLERYLPGLRAFVRLNAGKVLRSKESCSDLVQSACREVLQNAGDFAFGGEAGFKKWLYQTALRKIMHRHEHWRADKRDVRRELGQVPAAADDSEGAAVLSCYQGFYSPSQQAAAREELERVEAAFDRLPETHRQVIVMAKILGMTRTEIGAEIGRTEVAVRTLLSRALAQLADELVRPA